MRALRPEAGPLVLDQIDDATLPSTPGSPREHWVTATQPLLFPPLYMIERFARCDAVVLMQEAQHSRQAEHSWLMLSSPTGPLKVSLRCKSKNRRPLDEILVLDLERWCTDLRRRLRMAYGRQPGHAAIAASLDSFLDGLGRMTDPTLHEVARQTMLWCCGMVGVHPAWHDSKALVPERPASAPDWLAELASAAEATDYVQGETSIRDYFVPGAFRRHGIRVWAQDWRPGEVPRLGDPYNSRISVLDALLVAGPDWARSAIRADAGRGSAAGSMLWMAAYE
jgi:hypothetical protein